jgi:hypothetical protein
MVKVWNVFSTFYEIWNFIVAWTCGQADLVSCLRRQSIFYDFALYIKSHANKPIINFIVEEIKNFYKCTHRITYNVFFSIVRVWYETINSKINCQKYRLISFSGGQKTAPSSLIGFLINFIQTMLTDLQLVIRIDERNTLTIASPVTLFMFDMFGKDCANDGNLVTLNTVSYHK